MTTVSDEANNVLAIETTTEMCSVAVMSNGHCFEDTRFAPRLHNRYLLGMIDGLLAAACLEMRDLDTIAFSAGPGAFTGVRIGAAVAQGIAFAVGAWVVAVPSSAVAAEALRRFSNQRGVVSVTRASRPGWRYLARYELLETGVRCVEFDALVGVDSDASTDETMEQARHSLSANIVADLAMASPENAVSPENALPFYVEGDSPWRPTAPG